jgi:cytosine/adenosine deaminase-related metal-dependent hydrolase
LNHLKFQADLLFTGEEILDSSYVLITNKNGVVESIVAAKDAGDDVQQLRGLLTPGFVNCHCHLELSHMKGLIPEHTGLVNFVMNVMQHRHFPEEQILQAIKDAEDEMINNGIVAVGDICNNTYTLHQKKAGKLKYHNFIEVSGFVPQFAQQRFQQGYAVYEQFRSSFPDNTTIVPHAPYSVSQVLMQLINEVSAGKISTIHNQETPDEDAFYITGNSAFNTLYEKLNIDVTQFFKPSLKSSIQTVLPQLSLPKHLLLVHDTFTKEEDILFIRQTKSVKQQIFFCLCINANQYIEKAVPPVEFMRKNNFDIVLGTDSLSSNWSLNILDEIKTLSEKFSHIPLKEILQWATINGAKALDLDATFGNFEKGKKPGVVLITEMNGEVLSQKSKAKRLI